MTIDEFIQSELGKPFIWGETDCCSTANRWFLEHTGVDYLKTSGYDFKTKDEAKQILTQSLVKLFDDLCKSNGFKSTFHPQDGDLGLVKIYENGRPSAAVAIRYKGGWFSHAESGCLFFKNSKVIRSYKCPNFLPAS